MARQMWSEHVVDCKWTHPLEEQNIAHNYPALRLKMFRRKVLEEALV